MKTKVYAPGPRGFFAVLKDLKRMKKDPIEFFYNIKNEFGSISTMNIAGIKATVITNTASVRYVLQDNSANYKKSISYNELKHILGTGLLTSEGEIWKRNRRIVQPAFKSSMIESFSEIILEESDKMIHSWDKKSQLDIAQEMLKITFTVVGRSLFRKNLGDRADVIGSALTTALEIALDRMQSVLKFPVFIPTLKTLRLRKAIRTMNSLVYELIQERKKVGAGNSDLLDFLLGTKDAETGQGMSNKEIRDEVITFLMAGHETTSNALSWTLYLLHKHPEIKSKLRNEIQSVDQAYGFGFKTLDKMPYLKAVIQESMRIYPPVWIIERAPKTDDTIEGYHIPKGSIVSIPIYTLHRNPEIFPDPEKFYPERFLQNSTEPGKKLVFDPYQYLPFGGGPRICIGNHFAMMEASLILGKVLLKYDLELVSGFPVEMEASVTLRPKHGLQMKLTKVQSG